MRYATTHTTSPLNAFSAYRFHFNGQEADNEVAGSGNSYTAEFWQYDSRLGRRWNVDPVVKDWESPYATFRNNPIVLKDPRGDDVVNGDQIKADEKKEVRAGRSEARSMLMEVLNINENTTKRDFLKTGGSRKDWKEYRSITKEIRKIDKEIIGLQARADITADIIKRWSIESPSTFNEANNQEVDLILYSRDLTGTGYFGKNNITWNSKGIDFTPVGYDFYPKPAISVVIDQDVNISTIDPETGEYSLNHEAGHFLYIVQNPTKYAEYLKKLDKEKRKLNGGHNDDDESGKKASEYGGRK